MKKDIHTTNAGTPTQIRILLVDDHIPTRDEMRQLINRQGDMVAVGTAGTGEEALERAAELTPDAVVMDLLLPGMSGITTTEAILKHQPAVTVVALSNHSGRRLVQALKEAGGMGYVRKDHAFEELVPALRTSLAGTFFVGRDADQ